MNPDFLFKLLEGQVIDGKYHLKKLLGVGGFGAVFRADEVVRDRVLREVGIKVILPTGSATDTNRQLDELLTAVNLDHPHIIRCFAAGEFSYMDAPWLYLIMELAEYSLQTQVKRQPMDNTAIKDVMVQLAMALDYLHDQRLVHRDLKPANVLWANNVWKISDFGTVRSLNTQSYLQTVNSTGTIPYMPPEAFDGVVSSAWDIWSLGILAVVATTGALPYQFTDPNALLKRVMTAEIELDVLSSDLKLIIQPCLQPEWRKRCTAKQIIQKLIASSCAPTFVPPPSIPVKQEKPVVPSRPRGEMEQPKDRGNAYREFLPGNIELAMVAIPGGTFLMGSPDGEGEDSERRQHRVTVPTFYMGKYAVTNIQWKAVMGTHPDPTLDKNFLGDNQPVVRVSWRDAEAFCQKLSQMSGKAYRLPSEAEWEYACRAGTTTPFHFGDMITPNRANYDGNYTYKGSPKGDCRRTTTKVGSFPVNAWGLHDMHGNVWEWCLDHWHSNYAGAPTDGSAWLTNDTNAPRILRGGSWDSKPEACRSAYRDICPGISLNGYGFRVVCGL